MSFKKKFKKEARKHGLNALGILMLILVPILGPLPGPGGIPLLLGGLKLLSINNRWADQLHTYFKDKGLSLTDTLFSDSKKIQILWDVAVVGGLIGGTFLFFIIDHSILRIIISTVMTTLVFAGLRNRYRWQRLLKKLKITNS